MRVLAVEQAGAEEQSDRHRGDYNEEDERSTALFLERRPEPAQHQNGPQQEADEKVYLPEAAEIEILISLMA